jgi:ketosteroid isomerase-like protein
MSAEANIAIVRRYYEECTNDYGDPEKKRALAVADELLSPDFAMSYNTQSDVEAMRGKDTHKEFLLGHTQAFPGERWTIEGIVADERTVACQVRVEAAHADTGNPINIRMADFFTVQHGQLIELRRYLDFQTLMEQMQPKPTPNEASA